MIRKGQTPRAWVSCLWQKLRGFSPRCGSQAAAAGLGPCPVGAAAPLPQGNQSLPGVRSPPGHGEAAVEGEHSHVFPTAAAVSGQSAPGVSALACEHLWDKLALGAKARICF